MEFFLLDVGGAFLLPSAVLVFSIVAVFVESIVMLLLKLNRFGKCLLDSFIVNAVSLLGGYVLLYFTGRIDFIGQVSKLLSLFFLLIATVVIEGLLLMLLNKKTARSKIWVAAIIMNIVTYLILFLFNLAI